MKGHPQQLDIRKADRLPGSYYMGLLGWKVMVSLGKVTGFHLGKMPLFGMFGIAKEYEAE